MTELLLPNSRALRTATAAAGYALSAAYCCAPLASQVHLVDLHVYRMGGDAVLHDMSLYGLRYAGQLPFTYPPFAALVFTSLAWLPWAAAAVLMTALTVVALPGGLGRGARHRRAGDLARTGTQHTVLRPGQRLHRLGRAL